MTSTLTEESERNQKAELYERAHPEAARWAAGHGAIHHSTATRGRVFAMVERFATEAEQREAVFEILIAADLLANAALWLLAHRVYAAKIPEDGRELLARDFRDQPLSCPGGAFNLVPAYLGFYAVNAMTSMTRAWMIGQGHWAPAIETVDDLLGNSAGDPLGESFPGVRPGSTAFRPPGLGGVFGLAELQYVHVPLPGERLVAFLSDAAFEAQRGGDWAARWWRGEDSGLVSPIMIRNSRRIDQKTTLSEDDSSFEWLTQHLELNGFDPVLFDGSDPAAFAWAIFRIERRLETAREVIKRGEGRYPVSLPYGIAMAPRGAGFQVSRSRTGEGLPLFENPSHDAGAAAQFNQSVARLRVPPDDIAEARRRIQNHELSGRVREPDHPVFSRRVVLRQIPDAEFRPVAATRSDPALWTRSSPMAAIDLGFAAAAKANSQLRPRVGDFGDLRRMGMTQTLEALKFRVTDPETETAESVHGAVVSAFNEEAVAAAATANKGGINLIAGFEGFAIRLYPVLRQEMISGMQQMKAGRGREWLSVPVVLTGHAWEEGGMGGSHRDTALCELMMTQPPGIARVLFAADYNTAAVLVREVYQTRGEIWVIVAAQGALVPDLFTGEEARRLVREGALRLDWAGFEPDRARVVLTAIGERQLEETLRASRRLEERGVAHSVVCMIEPGRFRMAGSEGHPSLAAESVVRKLYPENVPARLFVTHTRAEPFLAVIQQAAGESGRTAVLGYRDWSGSANSGGLLAGNRATWGDILLETARLLGEEPGEWLSAEERDTLQERRSPH